MYILYVCSAITIIRFCEKFYQIGAEKYHLSITRTKTDSEAVTELTNIGTYTSETGVEIVRDKERKIRL